MFSAGVFRQAETASAFVAFIAELKKLVDAASPSPTHAFIQTLDSKKKLLRSYTQNIDGFESRTGLSCSSGLAETKTSASTNRRKIQDVQNVQLHGNIHRLRCILCKASFDFTEDYLKLLGDGTAPKCQDCVERCAYSYRPSIVVNFLLTEQLSANERVARRHRETRIGFLRPDVVLYDESHPLEDDIAEVQGKDLARRPDALLIMGTSMKVPGFVNMVRTFAKVVHDGASDRSKPYKVILVNKTWPGKDWEQIIDYHVEHAVDDWVKSVLQLWKRMKPKDWEVQRQPPARGMPPPPA